MKTILFASEVGRGFGHITRLAGLAMEAKRLGWRTVLATSRLSFVDTKKSTFDEVVAAPCWPGLLQESWFETGINRESPANSFAPVLAQLGAADPRVLSAIMLAWDGLFRLVKPDAIIGDYAPGVHLAAHQQIPSVAVGTGFTVPAVIEGRFALFRDRFPPDFLLQDRLQQALAEVIRRRGVDVPALPLTCITGNASFPICFPDLDVARGRREESVFYPDVTTVSPKTETNRTQIGVYFGPDLGPYAKIMEAVGKIRPDTEIYLDPSGQASGARPMLKQREHPFTVSGISDKCGLFIHHGGLGITQICAAAGVPQLILFSDTEKWLNAEAVMAQGAGIGLPVHLIKESDIAEAARSSAEPVMATNAKNWQEKLPAQQPKPSAGIAIMAAVAGLIGGSQV